MWAPRAPDPQPPAGQEGASGRALWVRAAAAGVLVGSCALGIAVASARGVDDLPTVHATFSLCWCIIALASGSALYLRWRMTGEAPVGLLAATLVVMSVPQLPLAVVDLAADPSESVRRLAPTSRLIMLLPAVWLLVRCARTAGVDSSLRPIRLTLGYTVAGAACPLAVLSMQSLDVSAGSTPPEPSLRWLPSILVVADLLAMASVGLLLFLAVSLLRSSVDSAGLRQRSLSVRAEAAEAALRREQERLHEVRSTVAGLRQASGTLRQYGERIEPHRRQHLREMMAEEAGRLERLLSPGQALGDLHPALLDDIVGPVVLSHRERGTRVRWQPSGARVLVRGDEVAEVLDILLANAREHAPGSAVEITVIELAGVVRLLVRDNGPGVRLDDARRLFDRGVRRADSPGQGLGLHIARRLAAESGGALTLLSSTDGQGAQFALSMPAGTAPQQLPMQAGPRLQEAR